MCALNLMKCLLHSIASATEGRNDGSKEMVGTGDEKTEPMDVHDKQEVNTFSTPQSAATQAPIQPRNVKTDDDKKVLFSIGPGGGTPHTNADKLMHRNTSPRPEPLASSSAVFETNADIPQDMMHPPKSAPPTSAHKHAHTVEKHFSSPEFSNAKQPDTPLNESQHIYSQFSETGPKGDYQAQVSIVDLPSEISPKVSMDDEAIMQRQQKRFKMIEEQNRTKLLQFKQTYSDPYSYKTTERVQSKQRRGQGG